MSTSHARFWRAQATRAAASLLALALAVAAILQVIRWRENRDRLLETLATSGTATAAVEREVRREITPHQAQLDAARALVFHLLEAPPVESMPPAEREAALEARRASLAEARALARAGLRAQPNSWQAAMLIGAATYIDWSLERDPRLFTESETWHAPLRKALREAPAQDEPRRLLASAYLELWPVLAPERKDFARDLLRRLFAEDPQAFDRLGPIWFEVAGDVDEALALVPSTPRAWEQVQATFAARHQHHLFVRARGRYLDSLEAALEAELEDGLTRLRLGDEFHSRTRFARVIAGAPTDLRFAPLVNEALAHYPPGLQPGGTGTAMQRWLRWSLELSEIWVYPLEPSNLSRLVTATGTAATADAALAALLGGELALAERLERMERRTLAWAPYLLAKAAWLLDRQRFDEAGKALDQVDPAVWSSAHYRLLQLRLARARGDRLASLRAEEEVARFRDDAWEARDWRERGGDRFLELLPSTPGTGLVIEVGDAAANGAAISLGVDGATVRELVAHRGNRIRLAVELSTDRPHRLRWRTLAGQAQPGAVRLLADG